MKARRKDYERAQVDDKKILKILDTITGVFGKSVKTTKKQQDEIVKELEKREDVLAVANEEKVEPDEVSDNANESAASDPVVNEFKPEKTKAPINKVESNKPAVTGTASKRIKPKI